MLLPEVYPIEAHDARVSVTGQDLIERQVEVTVEEGNADDNGNDNGVQPRQRQNVNSVQLLLRIEWSARMTWSHVIQPPDTVESEELFVRPLSKMKLNMWCDY